MMHNYSCETCSPSEMSLNIVRLFAYNFKRVTSDGVMRFVCQGEA